MYLNDVKINCEIVVSKSATINQLFCGSASVFLKIDDIECAYILKAFAEFKIRDPGMDGQ